MGSRRARSAAIAGFLAALITGQAWSMAAGSSTRLYDDLGAFSRSAESIVVGSVLGSRDAQSSLGACGDVIVGVLARKVLKGPTMVGEVLTVRLEDHCDSGGPSPSTDALFFLTCDTTLGDYTPTTTSGVIEDRDGGVHVEPSEATPFLDGWEGRPFSRLKRAIRTAVSDPPRSTMEPRIRHGTSLVALMEEPFGWITRLSAAIEKRPSASHRPVCG